MGTLNCANIITNNMDVNGTLEVDALSGLNQGFQLGSFQNSNRPTGVSAGTIIWNDEFLKIKWPKIHTKITLSKKDLKGKNFKNCENF